jgi:AbrB family looped-hinge helix DNA binding protein
MPASTTVTVNARGVITLPKKLRDRYGIHPGDSLTIIDLDGVMVIASGATRIHGIANRIRDELEQRGETLESMISAVREERERYGR